MTDDDAATTATATATITATSGSRTFINNFFSRMSAVSNNNFRDNRPKYGRVFIYTRTLLT